MKRYIAKFSKNFEIDKVQYKKGDTIVLEYSEEYKPAYWIVRDGVRSTDMLTNQDGIIFDVVEELEVAA